MRKCKAKIYQIQQKALQNNCLYIINNTHKCDIVAQGIKTFGYRELVVNRYQTININRISSSIQTLKKKKLFCFFLSG